MWEERFKQHFAAPPFRWKLVIPRRVGVIEDFENIECEEIFNRLPWTEVDRKRLAYDGASSFGYLTEDAFGYYVPAMLLAAIEYPKSNLGDGMQWVFSDNPELIGRLCDKLTAEQRQLIWDALYHIMKAQHGDDLETDELPASALKAITQSLLGK